MNENVLERMNMNNLAFDFPTSKITLHLSIISGFLKRFHRIATITNVWYYFINGGKKDFRNYSLQNPLLSASTPEHRRVKDVLFSA